MRRQLMSNEFNFKYATLKNQYLVIIQIQHHEAESFLEKINREVDLGYGNYDMCAFISSTGISKYRHLEGSEGGASEKIHSVETTEIVLTINKTNSELEKLIDVIYYYHPFEEPVVLVSDTMSGLYNGNGDKSNPNKWWNRSDRNKLI